MRSRKGLVLRAATTWLTALVLPRLPLAAQTDASGDITRPFISEDTAPLQPIAPIARDGHRGHGFIRQPPGAGPFPAVVIIHGGLVTVNAERLKQYWSTIPLPSRFLAAGYVVAVISYRSRDDDPQSTVSSADCLAAVEHLRGLPQVDRKSIVVFGCSGGGDLALELAAATDLAAIAPEEPASILFTGVFNRQSPKRGNRFTPPDSSPISAEPKRYYTEEYQKLTREKISRIRSPILIVQGDKHEINRFNAEVMIPELRAAGKKLDVITYPGEDHCFCFGNRTKEGALKAFQDIDAFFQRHMPTKPVPIDGTNVKRVPLSE